VFFGSNKGSPKRYERCCCFVVVVAVVVVVVVVVVKFSKIPLVFVNTQPIVVKLRTDICDRVTHPSIVSNFQADC